MVRLSIGLFKRRHKTHLFFQFTLSFTSRNLILIKYYLYNTLLFFFQHSKQVRHNAIVLSITLTLALFCPCV